MKYKQEYLSLLDKVNRLEYKLEQRELEKHEYERELAVSMARCDELRKFASQIEGKESDVRRENEWLKTTLRLVIVDADKIKGLATELEKDDRSFAYKI